MTLPLLSFCIPTYNRASNLRALLENLVAAAPACGSRIEILVSDNASDDETETVAKEFSSRLPMMTYSRNTKNIGGEANFARLIDMSRGAYIWLFGDDDILLPGGLKRILCELDMARGYLILNHGSVVHDRRLKTAQFPAGRDIELSDQNLVMRQFGLRLGFMTNVIFRRDVLLGVTREDFLRLAPTGLSFLYCALAAAANNRGFYIASPTFDYLAGNSDYAVDPDWWTRVYGVGLRGGLDEAAARFGYSKKAVRVFYSKVIWEFYLGGALLARERGRPTLVYYRSLLSVYRDIPVSWLVMLSILIPGKLVTALRHIRRR